MSLVTSVLNRGRVIPVERTEEGSLENARESLWSGNFPKRERTFETEVFFCVSIVLSVFKL